MAQDTPEKSILEKLAQTQTFHPAGAKLFVPDWTLDPGDVVTVTSKKDVHDPDEEPTEYKVPIYSMDLTWNGKSRLDIQSTGNQEREPLSALRRKEYQTGRRGYGMQKEIEEETQQQYEHYTEQTDAYRKEIYRVNGVVYDSNGNIVYQTDPVTGEYILDNAGNKIPVYNPESNGSISGQVIQSAQRMATIIKQSGTVYEVFSETKQYYEGDRVLYPDSNGTPYKFINDHNPGPWKGDGEHGDVVSLGTLQSQIDNNTDNFNIFYGDVNERLGTIEGSQLWGDADELIAINGKMRVDGNKLIIEEGGGLYTERTVSGRIVQSGIWDAGNLTAGTIVQTINGTTETTIRADKVNLEGYVTASYVDTAVLLADSLTSDNGYIGNIKASNINTGGNINASGAVYGSGIYITSTSEQGQTIYTDLSNAVKTIQKNNDAPDGQIGIKFNTFGNATWIPINFNIADTAKYKADVGISSVDPGNWQYDSTEHKYYNPVVATAKDSTQANPDTMTANVFIPDITLTPVVNGLTYVGKVNAWGPSVSGTVYAAADELSLYLKEKDNYVYITKTDSDPVPVGPNSNVVARMEIQGGGSEEDYNQGYADGQTNARAEISGIILNRTYTSYSDNNLSIKISGTPKLVLLSNDDPPVETERTGQRLDVDTTMVVRTTNASLSERTFTNGQYTITGTGGNVNVDSVDGVGGANIPVGVTPLTFTPTDALNSVNVVKGNWTGTTTRTISFTTDAPSPNASAPKSVTLSWNNGDWVWAASDDSGNYQKQIQVKDGLSVAMTDYVDMPDISVTVDTPQQQESWWKESGTYAYKYVIPQIGATGYLSSDTSHQHPLGLWHNNNIVIDPAKAIEHGKNQVNVTRTWDEYTGSTTGAATLESGKTYQLQVKKDGTNVVDELYSVPAQASPTVNTWGLTHQTGTEYTYKASVNVNGTSYESGNLNATEAYNNGWTGAYQSVGIFPTAVADLVPGGSPITIYAQAKATSGSAKSNVASVQVKARALNLKDETFRSNDTYTVPSGYDGYGTITVDVQGGGGDYYSTFLDKITLSNTDIGDSVQKYSIANYSDGHRDSEAKTRVVIDASAVYSAGVTAGIGGVVNVEKQPWDGNTCEFKPSAGEGTSASVTITAEPTKVSLASATSTGEIVLKDGSNQFATKNLYLRQRTLNGQNYVVLTDTSSIVSVGNVLAKYSASGGGGTGETRSVYNISDIVLNPADIGPSVVKYPTLYYDDETDDNTIPIYIDASAVYRRGQQDGAGISILDTYTTTIDSNNTTITLLPSEKGDYNVMASARVTVEVPVHEGVQGATLLASTDSDTAWGGWQLNDYTQLGKKYGFIKITGKDQSTYSYGIDATDLWDSGVAEGAKAAGYQLTTVKVAESPVKYRAINVPTGTATVKGVTDVTAALYVRDNNGSVHLRGSAVSRYENKSMTLYYMDQSGTARPAGTGSWFFVSDKNVTELYRSGLGLSLVSNATNTFTVATGSRSAFVEDSTGAYTFYSGRDVSNTYFIRSN